MAILLLFLASGKATADGLPQITLSGEGIRNIQPGGTATHKLMVENQGDTDDFDISLSYHNPDGNWTVYTSRKNLSLNAMESGTFYLYVIPHDNNTTPVDRAEMELNVSVAARTGDAMNSLQTLVRCVHDPDFGVNIYAANETNRLNQTANPSNMSKDGMEYRFRVTNTGEVEDSFHLSVETNNLSGTFRNWNINFDTGSGFRTAMEVPADVPLWTGPPSLLPGEEIEIKVFVEPPQNEDASGNDLDKYGDMEIFAESLQDSQQTDSIFFRLIVIRPDLRIESDDIHFDTQDKIEEDDNVDLEVTIHNDGQAESGKFDVWLYRNKEGSFSGIGGIVGSGGLIAHEKDVDSIDSSSVYTLELDWEIEWGEHDLYVFVDKPITSGSDKTDDSDKGNVIEESERNNDAKIGIDPRSGKSYSEFIDLRPWIEIIKIDWNKGPEEDETITVTIFNNDSHDAVAPYGDASEDVDMYIRCKAGDDFLKPVKFGTADQGYRVNEAMEPDDELEIEFLWQGTRDAERYVEIKAYIDYDENKNDIPQYSIKITDHRPPPPPPPFVTLQTLINIAFLILLPLGLIMTFILLEQRHKLHYQKRKLRCWEPHAARSKQREKEVFQKPGNSAPLPLKEKERKGGDQGQNR